MSAASRPTGPLRLPMLLAGMLAASLIVGGLLLFSGAAHAATGATSAEGRTGGPFGLDRYDAREDRGILSRVHQKRLDLLALGTLGATALWEGSETPTGRVAWQGVDAVLVTAVATETLKNVFQRPRPSQNANPDTWFAGSGHKSFPSGETAMMAAIVTPAILAHQAQAPGVWALAALPVYMGAARMSSQGHWLTDVLAGAGVGVLVGQWAHAREQPLVLGLTPGGVFVGMTQRF